MSLLEITKATAHVIYDGSGNDRFGITVDGSFATSGWSGVMLSPWIYAVKPSDGVWDFNLTAREPTGLVCQVLTKFSTDGVFTKPEWLKKIRIHGGNVVEVDVESTKNSMWKEYKDIRKSRQNKGLIAQQIISYEDSHQPTGNVEWDWGVPHFEMKKLVHSVVVTVEGIDEHTAESVVRGCINRAFTDGLISAILAAFISGGIAAVNAFVGVALESMKNCLGNQLINITFSDNSHWEYWHT